MSEQASLFQSSIGEYCPIFRRNFTRKSLQLASSEAFFDNARNFRFQFIQPFRFRCLF
ncbi:hypothetical protein N665_0028s0004 [Sinapis alba]|nr:hypothetical protein N665_0028s0004 [Sinapis alba]